MNPKSNEMRNEMRHIGRIGHIGYIGHGKRIARA